ncbi:lysylphosphatidylglycerol synthase domain-containing protein [Komagataeibacter sp. FXV3]|uniref:lysylphosphatidylglycerol synthase domain-containing protein n=1 Tax=Komagataeibacter sp. FXV3 TaxID=2608998 RepID=UPI00187B770D|nr:lysylphosphatidylglycerol synthase domain-containing protein [Komagataeibacter sp. FXV3]MBE7730280.1 HpnL family protein [Komagataeibacter sp. FXV3]
MRKLTILLAILGLALLTGCTAWLGAGSVMKAIVSIGFTGFMATVMAQLAVDAILGLAWHAACRDIPFVQLLVSRMIRDAAASCLPFSQLGGMVLGIRATCSSDLFAGAKGRHVDGSEAACANLVDITTEVMGQILFILTAVACLVAHQQSSPFARPVMIGLVLLSMGIAGFIYTQRRGGDLLKRAGKMLGNNMAAQWQDAMLSSADSIQERFDAIWSHPSRIVQGALLHYVGWLGSAATIWVAYYFLGAHLGFGGAIAIEGVACGIMSVSFLVPAGLGVQEAAYMALGSAFGIAPSVSLGLSLLRRGRELVIGIPMLLLWQAMEMRALRRRSTQGETAPAAAPVSIHDSTPPTDITRD